MSMGCPGCRSLRTNVHSPLCRFAKYHPPIAEMTNEGCVINRDWAIQQVMGVLEKYALLDPANDIVLTGEIVDSLVVSHLPSLGDERVRQLRQSLRSIADACVAGKVCDDIAWMDDITTLFDYCEQALDHDLGFEAELQAAQSRVAAFNSSLLGDTSFPFLQIASAFGVDYGDVLLCADALDDDSDRNGTEAEVAALNRIGAFPHVIASVQHAIENENLRREKVMHG